MVPFHPPYISTCRNHSLPFENGGPVAGGELSRAGKMGESGADSQEYVFPDDLKCVAGSFAFTLVYFASGIYGFV